MGVNAIKECCSMRLILQQDWQRSSGGGGFRHSRACIKKDDFLRCLRATRVWREGVVLLVDDTSSALHVSP